MSKKLYRVEFEAAIEMPVVAESRDEAREIAKINLRHEISNYSLRDLWLCEGAFPVRSKEEIPSDWRGGFAWANDADDGEWIIDRLPDEFFSSSKEE